MAFANLFLWIFAYCFPQINHTFLWLCMHANPPTKLSNILFFAVSSIWRLMFRVWRSVCLSVISRPYRALLVVHLYRCNSIVPIVLWFQFTKVIDERRIDFHTNWVEFTISWWAISTHFLIFWSLSRRPSFRVAQLLAASKLAKQKQQLNQDETLPRQPIMQTDMRGSWRTICAW